MAASLEVTLAMGSSDSGCRTEAVFEWATASYIWEGTSRLDCCHNAASVRRLLGADTTSPQPQWGLHNMDGGRRNLRTTQESSPVVSNLDSVEPDSATLGR